MTFNDLLAKLDSLCWSARRWGHDDYGLDYGVTAQGDEAQDSDEETYHPEAYELAVKLAEQFGVER